MEFIDELKLYRLDEVKRDSNWFYHGFSLSLYNEAGEFKSMMEDGLLCQALRHTKDAGCNGYFYVSVSKIVDCANYDSSYLTITSRMPAFIIEGLKPIKTHYYCPIAFKYTFLPIRYSPYDDEYQKFMRVDSCKLIGLQMSIKELELYINKNSKFLGSIVDILDYLIYVNESFPFYIFDNPKEDLYLMDKVKCRDLLHECKNRCSD